MAKLYFRYGAMSSGKSAYLLQAAHNYEESGRTVVLAKPAVDVKAGDMVSSRIGISRKIDFIIKPDTNVFSTFNEYNQKHLEEYGSPVACLLVDESQFLKREQVNQLLKVASLLNVPVLCFGIRSDFMTNGFEGSDRLMQLAHSIEEMKTICASCGAGKATLNARRVNGEYVFEGDKVSIDVASDPTKKNKTSVKYESLCSSCYLKFSEGKLGSD
jgi:thymidine kinase